MKKLLLPTIALSIIIIIVIIASAECGQRVDIILSGRDIKKTGYWFEPDAYVKVFYKFESNQNWINYGRTSTGSSNPNPNWMEVFTFDYVAGSSQLVKYEVWDENMFWDTLIGTLELHLRDIVRSAVEGGGMSVERQISPSESGRLLMKVRIDGTIPFSSKSIDNRPGPLSK